MKFTKIFLSIGLLAVSSLGALDKNNSNEVSQELMQTINETAMQAFHNLFFQGMVDLRVKYNNEIKWLKKNYWHNTAEGDKVIVLLKDEFVKLFVPNISPMFDQMFEQIPELQQIGNLKNIFVQQFSLQIPQMMEMSLKENMLIESMAYARLHGLR